MSRELGADQPWYTESSNRGKCLRPSEEPGQFLREHQKKGEKLPLRWLKNTSSGIWKRPIGWK